MNKEALENMLCNFGHDCHIETFLAVAQTRANRTRYYRVCKTCGRKTRSVRLRELSPTDKQNAIAYDENQAKSWWDEEYGRYLQSSTWREKRRKVLERANYVCEGCGEQKATEVHHLTYKRVGKEMLFDLVAVCHQCHLICHEESDG